jgi:hypothetical protein
MTLLQFPFLFLVLGSLLGQRPLACFAFDNATTLPNKCCGFGLDQNTLGRGFCSFFDFERLAQVLSPLKTITRL